MAGAEVLLSSTADVKALVPDFIFKRAKEVVSSSKLHDVSFQGPSLEQSSATCTGSNPGDNYRLSILINTGSSSNPTCQCSCPAAPKTKGNLCKHVVALLLLRSKELTKVAKDQANAAVLSEFKLAEDRLFEGRQSEPTLSDSQATEVFVPSDDKVNNDISTTASSVSPVIMNNQRRVLPTWISEGYCPPKKDVKETKVARKAGGKTDAFIKEEGRAYTTVVGGNEISQTGRGKGKSRVLDEGGTTKSVGKKQKDSTGGRVQDTGYEAEETPEVEQKTLSRPARRSTRKNATTFVKNGCVPGQKRRRRGAYVESDLSEEEDPEVLDDECSFEAKEDLALTTEDLVNLATEHLETEKGKNNEPGHYQPGESVIDDESHKNTAASKRKGSIFSVQGWNEIATKGLDGKGTSYSQETSQLPSTFLSDINTGHSEASAELGTDSRVLGDTTKGLDCLGTAENVVDDMLGLIFGPTLSKTVNTRSESSQNLVQDVNKSTVTFPEADMLDVVLPVSNDSAPQPKKKSSLKDKVVMYLG